MPEDKRLEADPTQRVSQWLAASSDDARTSRDGRGTDRDAPMTSRDGRGTDRDTPMTSRDGPERAMIGRSSGVISSRKVTG